MVDFQQETFPSIFGIQTGISNREHPPATGMPDKLKNPAKTTVISMTFGAGWKSWSTKPIENVPF